MFYESVVDQRRTNLTGFTTVNSMLTVYVSTAITVHCI